MTAQILNEVEAARFGNAFAYCVVLITIVLVVIGILNILFLLTTPERFGRSDCEGHRHDCHQLPGA
ncbi:hypothetical protein [Tessaracoccus sp.]|uniref:hypothetical protein n=1 Tax=Tessaracoccus sp. TaxID=1971211 RepID=UPI002603A476|nr:hypothetical protein [Tessaracoccus sp.]